MVRSVQEHDSGMNANDANDANEAKDAPTQTEEEKPLLEIFYEQLSSLRRILCEQLLPAHDAQREEALRCLARDKQEIMKMSAPNPPDDYAMSVHEELTEFETNLLLQKKHDETAIKMFDHYDSVIRSMIQNHKNA